MRACTCVRLASWPAARLICVPSALWWMVSDLFTSFPLPFCSWFCVAGVPWRTKKAVDTEGGTTLGVIVERVAQSNRLSKMFYANEACFLQLLRHRTRLKLVLWMCHSDCFGLGFCWFLKRMFLTSTTTVKCLELHTLYGFIRHIPLLLASLVNVCQKL